MFEAIFPIKVITHQSDVMTISIIVLTLDYKPMYGLTKKIYVLKGVKNYGKKVTRDTILVHVIVVGPMFIFIESTCQHCPMCFL
jgi:hypothetical protein